MGDRASLTAPLPECSLCGHDEAENNAIIAEAMRGHQRDRDLLAVHARRADYFAKLLGLPAESTWSDIEGAIRELVSARDSPYPQVLEMREWADRWIVSFETALAERGKQWEERRRSEGYRVVVPAQVAADEAFE